MLQTSCDEKATKPGTQQTPPEKATHDKKSATPGAQQSEDRHLSPSLNKNRHIEQPNGTQKNNNYIKQDTNSIARIISIANVGGYQSTNYG